MNGGIIGDIVVSPTFVTVKLLVELSMNLFDWHVSKLVFAIAVSGDVGGVNAVVYTKEPVTTLKFDIYPKNADVPLAAYPIAGGLLGANAV